MVRERFDIHIHTVRRCCSEWSCGTSIDADAGVGVVAQVVGSILNFSGSNSGHSTPKTNILHLRVSALKVSGEKSWELVSSKPLGEKRGVTFRSQSTGGTTLEEIGNTAKEARKSAALDGQQGRVVTMVIS